MDGTDGPRPIAAFDLDGTFFREHLLFMLFKTFFELHVFSRATQSAFEDLAIDYRDRKIPHVEYNEALITLFDENIRGVRVRDIMSAARRAARDYHGWVYTFTRSLFETLGTTHQRITITGAVKEVVEELVRYWPFEAVYATELAIKNGAFTGKHHKIHVDDKRDVLNQHVRATSAPFRDSVAIGDTGSDIVMLASVERPIAFNPNDALAEEAERRGWPIVIERKDCIYVVRKGSCRRFNIDDAAEAVAFVLSLDRGNGRGR